MDRILIFAGTTEGRRLAEFCAENGIPADASSATGYGASLLPKEVGALSGRLDADEISCLLRTGQYGTVIDATHPYAADITRTLRAVCTACGMPYLRLLREPEPVSGESAPDMETLISRLNATDDIILSTLGSKSVQALTAVRGYAERVWLRILPSPDAAAECVRLGYRSVQIIQAKGPFTVADNICHILQSCARILLTKESGRIGGYPEKTEAVRKTGVRMLTLCRPPETGFSYDDIAAMLLRMKENAE